MAVTTRKLSSLNDEAGSAAARVVRFHPLLAVGFGVLLVGMATTAGAALMVNLASTPVGGGVFQYDVSISNTGPKDVVVVTIGDAPVGDPLIGPSLTVPVGFFPSYDSGLGKIDFLEDTELFGVGTTHGGFAFQSSASPPANFTAFEALDLDGGFISGSITVVPEPTGIVLALSGLAVVAMLRGRRIVWDHC
jgi:hypothetical protein